MQLIELHIIQSFPVSCLNRDDVGSPKTACFGGVMRSRLSSQCLKRATRTFGQDQANGLAVDARFGGVRTRLIVDLFNQELQKNGLSVEDASLHAKHISDLISKSDAKNEEAVKTMTFLAPGEIAGISKTVAEFLKKSAPTETKPEKKGKKDQMGFGYEGLIVKACKSAGLMDAADIALFGRMAASLPDLTVEASAMFGHALSTHQVENDLDFFSAVDELKNDDHGAGMIGTIEFNAAVYYRYVAINLDMLADEEHLKGLNLEERRAVVASFIRSALLAVPGARKSSMNANTAPSYVLGIVKSGQPFQLINAFETPIRSKQGIIASSIEALKAHNAAQKKTWNLTHTVEVAIPDTNLNDFCNQLTAHVI